MIRINLARKKPVSAGGGGISPSEGGGSSLKSIFEGRRSEIWTFISVIGIPLAIGFIANSFFDEYVEKRMMEVRKEMEDREKEKQKIERDLESVKGYEGIKTQLEQNSMIIRTKVDTIEKLILDRDYAAKSLLALAQSIPKEVWIRDYSFQNKEYKLSGSSLDAGLISDFMGRLQKSIYYNNLQLKSSASTDGQGMKADFVLEGKVE